MEALTYRLRGHYEGDPGKYRELSELADWKAKDPIRRLRHPRRHGRLKADELRALERACASSSADAATEAALAAPWPAADERRDAR